MQQKKLQTMEHEHHHEHEEGHGRLITILVAAVLLAAAYIVERKTDWTTWQYLLLYMLPYLVVGWETLKEAGEGLLHGEAVSVGMPPFCGEKARGELEEVLRRFGLPTSLGPWQTEPILEAVRHDKKRHLNRVTVVTVPEIGRFEFQDPTFEDLRDLRIKENER